MTHVHVYHDDWTTYEVAAIASLAERLGCDVDDIRMIPDERFRYRGPLIVLDGGEPEEATV